MPAKPVSLRLRLMAMGAGLIVMTGGVALAQSVADLKTVKELGAWGVDLTARDPKANPGDDFYNFAQGTGTAKMEIPADRSAWGSFYELRDLSDARSRAVIEKAAADKSAKGEAQQIGAFYRSFMDEAGVEKLDAKPIQPELNAIKAAKTKAQIATLMGKAPMTGYGAFFGTAVQDDPKVPNRYTVMLGQAGLGLPDRDYYLESRFATQKAAYQAYIAQQLTAVGWPEADKRAAEIVALETDIAKASWSRAEQRDDNKMYNATAAADLPKLAPGFPWKEFMTAAKLGGVNRVVVNENTAFPKIAAIYDKASVEALQAWMAFHLVNGASPYLSKRFVDASFAFNGKILSGQPEQRPRWKRGVGVVGADMGEAVGKLYVAEYFPAAYKAQMEALVGNLKVAMRARLQKADWMTPATRAQALEKLDKLGVKIGYPNKWRDYSKLTLKDGDLLGNVERSSAYEWEFRIGRLGGPINRDEWEMFPQTVNAYYNPAKNEVVFPAAILQPPFFDPRADAAVNYGAIGAVIGHEITHAFDDQGRNFDATGQLRDWWTPEDAAKFTVQAKRLGAQYSAFEPFPGAHVNGDLTMGENIADLGGVLMAYDAYRTSLAGKPAPVIDGLDADQRFYYGFAQIWRSKMREAQARQQLVTDPHSPNYYRVNGTLRNVDTWYQAFGVKPGEKLYVDPAQRVRIW